MHIPTRRQERTTAGGIAVGVMVGSLIAAVLVSTELALLILSLGTAAILAYIELTNWLIGRSRNPR